MSPMKHFFQKLIICPNSLRTTSDSLKEKSDSATTQVAWEYCLLICDVLESGLSCMKDNTGFSEEVGFLVDFWQLFASSNKSPVSSNHIYDVDKRATEIY